MKSLFKGIWWLITLPLKIVWKIRKLLVLTGTAFGVYKKYQGKHESAGAEESTETSDS